MANILSIEKQTAAVAALAEGVSIRSIERMTGVHRDTIMRLGVRVGQACEKLLDVSMRGLQCQRIEVDEIWGFIQKKERAVTELDNPAEVGDVWTFVAIDPDSKAVPSYVVGKRDYGHTHRFISDLSTRIKGRIQLSSDAMTSYQSVVEQVYGADVDYGQIVKTYGTPDADGQRRYSPPQIQSVRRVVVAGDPNERRISTSIIERQNLTMRMHCRRLTRLTNAFSKKPENFRAAIGLHFGYYNFVKIHSSIRCTPAMAVGASSRLWKVEDLVELAAA